MMAVYDKLEDAHETYIIAAKVDLDANEDEAKYLDQANTELVWIVRYCK
jgi:hypothetical protein